MTVEYDVGTGTIFDIKMNVEHKVIDNFLDKNNLEKLEDQVMSAYMPWYFNDHVNIKGDDHFQFVYGFVHPGGEPNCNEFMMNLLEPFAVKLKVKNFHRVKANLSTKTNKLIEHGMHTDRRNMKGKTGIFYLNTCNGYTRLENGVKIKSKKNRFVEFDCNTRHTGSSCTDQKRRVVINFNY
tara:strand:+ start:2460 stop:3002 length:543 start_codon:yes stop_codon:yes gene_type:complete